MKKLERVGGKDGRKRNKEGRKKGRGKKVVNGRKE